MNIKNEEDKALEDKQIKNAVIDLLHNNEEVTYEAISKASDISPTRIERHNESIEAMLSKLKKVYISPQFKGETDL